VEALERQEQERYEKKLEAMKKEVAAQSSSINVEAELQQYKETLEEDFELQLRDYRKHLESQA
jgi:hypothetical protein